MKSSNLKDSDRMPRFHHCVKIKFIKIIIFFLLVLVGLEAKPIATIDSSDVTSKMHEIMRAHATYKKMSPLLAKRALDNFIAILDPAKTYFLQAEIAKWLSPSEQLLERISQDFERSRFSAFEEIFGLTRGCIERRARFEQRLLKQRLPRNVTAQEFKHLQWSDTEEALYDKLVRMRALHTEAIEKMDGEFKELATQRLLKIRLKNEEILISNDKEERQQLLCTYLLKAFASALDTHTVYFTPAEASQFLISLQQRLIGIGVQLRDDLDGFTIEKVIEGSPLEASKELRVKDKIIAIDRQPVVGLDGLEAVDRIRGPEGTEVVITVLREVMVDNERRTETKEVRVVRKEIVIADSRVQSSAEAFGDGVVANLRLHAFYQDGESCSASDLSNAFAKIAAEHKIKGVVLDLRGNAGGLLAQAVEVVGLFTKKGIVASIKDENGSVQHFRNIDAKRIWDGPLVVLVDRFSASAAEIVAQSLQDYQRALIVGDDHTFGKGSFQIFTLVADDCVVDPQGEHKVTRGRYYTVSGKTPQLVGVHSDIVIPGVLTFEEVGEAYTKYPLDNEAIAPNFDDKLTDVPFYQRDRIRKIYQHEQQKPIPLYKPYIEQLTKNSSQRIAANKGYQDFLDRLKVPNLPFDMPSGLMDFQLQETINLIKDLILLVECSSYEKKLEQQKVA